VEAEEHLIQGRIVGMGYKLLGFLVWQGSKWYLRRRMMGARRKVALAAVGAAIAAGVVVAGRQAASSE
jgi:hypothetical protein